MSLYARLSGFYFFYYATVGAFMPYWSPYLESRGFSAAQMGVAYALMGLTRSFMPIVWGWIADASGRRVSVVRAGAVISLLLFVCIPFAQSIAAVAFFMVAYSIFWHAMLPQFEVVALIHIGEQGDYSRVRVWGSVGFVAVVLGLGAVLDRSGMGPLPWFVAGFFVLMGLSSWTVPEVPQLSRGGGAPASLLEALRRPGVATVLAVCLLSQLSFAPYYNFFTLFLERHQYSRAAAGALWALAVLAEIGLFLVMGRLISRHGARRLLVAVLGATAVRWLLTALLVDSLPLLIVLQLSHALTFGAYHALAVFYVQQLFPGSLQGRGQAVYNAVAYGIGGAVGSLGAGFLWQHLSPEAMFVAAAIAAAIGWWIAWRGLPEAVRSAASPA
ncbi:MAG TPA: MFS transporter [Candidatus Binatia bacterium]|nr:MFS transporter [Candidatus Binatia bacterium]